MEDPNVLHDDVPETAPVTVSPTVPRAERKRNWNVTETAPVTETYSHAQSLRILFLHQHLVIYDVLVEK